MTDVTVASLNIRGIPPAGSRLAVRCQAIGSFFEASDVDVVCFQEVYTYAHLVLIARQMRSFRQVSFVRALPGPAGDVVTFSRAPVASTTFCRFGPVTARVPPLARLQARMKGALTTTLTDPRRLFKDFISETGLSDAFGGRCPPTFRVEYLPAAARLCCIDFILTGGEVSASSAEVLFTGRQELRGGPGHVSDHVGLSARMRLLDPVV